MDNLKKAQKLIKFGQITKDDIVIGKDEVDRKFLTPCGPVYTAYHDCLKQNYGDVIICDKFREKMIECEVSQGFFKYDVSDIRRRRQKLHGSEA
ncbi:unnamed protein product [Paramecium pentaurelia]|uniref:Uncharacterized protein n=1 Tax=Paramecium pentaurelia TaxID=43138 RepID=A0A8S1T4M3_9CILI|nr:unnamed protein product [Paramecium pentaurelia]